MAVTRVEEDHAERRSATRKTGTNSSGLPEYESTHTRAFKVWTDDIQDGTAIAMRAFDVPAPGDRHDFDIDAFAVGITAEPLDGSGTHFKVRVDYSDADDDGGSSDDFVPPLDRPWEVRWGGSESTSAYFLDESTPPKPLTNSAGERFAALLERETSELTLTVVKNEAVGEPGEDEEYSHTTNLNQVALAGTVFGEGTLKMSPIASVYTVEQRGTTTYQFFRKTYTLKARRKGWTHEVEDAGFNESETEVSPGSPPTTITTLTPILNARGLRVDTPWPLDGSGKKLASLEADRVLLEFKPYEPKDWRSRGFFYDPPPE